MPVFATRSPAGQETKQERFKILSAHIRNSRLSGLEVLALLRKMHNWRAITVANRDNHRAMINDAGIDKDKEWK